MPTGTMLASMPSSLNSALVMGTLPKVIAPTPTLRPSRSLSDFRGESASTANSHPEARVAL
ncbi:Uncharacterised protein [Bordetella pertussis]|nr:Uncharacterised protein [Bordetella pertussis]